MTEIATPDSGRDERGLFRPGNTISKGVGGNPNVKRMAELKQALIACGTVEDVQKLYAALLAAALGGDTSAAKLILDHLVGRPTQPIEVTGSGPAPIQTDITAIVAIIQQEEPDPDRRLKIARRILSLGQHSVEVASDGPIDADSVALDPSLLMEMAGLTPDPWQRELLRSQSDRVLLLCSRQLGKSTSTAFVALNQAYLSPGSLILLSSKTERQAGELFKKITFYHHRLDLVTSSRDMALTLELANGSRIIALCGEGDNFRGFSDPALCLVDEASIVDESVLTALLPMLVVSGGRLIALSTPMGKRGWFYERWIDDESTWQRVNAKAIDSPRIDRSRLEQQKRDMGERKFSQEFDNVFIEAEGQLFSDETIAAIFDHAGFDGALPPLLGI